VECNASHECLYNNGRKLQKVSTAFLQPVTSKTRFKLHLLQDTSMDLTLKKTELLILGVTALVCSRAMFAFFNDPEGPNLLIVIVAAAIVYLLSLVAYVWTPSATPAKRLLLAISTQIVLVAGAYFFLK
jgi:hypothetical protein